MDKLQTVVVILLVVAIIFSVASVAMNIYLTKLKPVNAQAIANPVIKGNDGNLQVGILPAESEGELP